MVIECVTLKHFIDFLPSFPESLRKFPPGASIIRKVTKDYQVPGTKHVLKKGMTAISSIYGIHHDPEIYPNPEEYDPERFTPENSAKRHPMAFIPFGEYFPSKRLFVH